MIYKTGDKYRCKLSPEVTIDHVVAGIKYYSEGAYRIGAAMEVHLTNGTSIKADEFEKNYEKQEEPKANVRRRGGCDGCKYEKDLIPDVCHGDNASYCDHVSKPIFGSKFERTPINDCFEPLKMQETWKLYDPHPKFKEFIREGFNEDRPGYLPSELFIKIAWEASRKFHAPWSDK